MKPYVLAKRASDDLLAIERYLQTTAGPEIALEVIRRIRTKIEKINLNPGLGHLRKDITDRPVRFCSEYSYLIIYLPQKPVRIVRILHGRRDLQLLLKGHGKS